ncbi:MAG: NAD(P)H-hydrate dehydratase [Lachnospiraceae bacterium]|nr:NAD(P)H-hydrate dehydratase [Lachnospiraceae bacterium]
MSEITNKSITWMDAVQVIPKRDPRGHKGTFGKVLVVGGSHGMAGAAYFSARAALLMGCGMVRIATHECNRIIMQIKLPEALLSTYEDRHFEDVIFDAIRWADAVVIGPGLSTESPEKEVFKYAFEKSCEAGLPMIIDADGINILAGKMSLLEGEHPPIILTPHLGEMARLTGASVEVIADNMPEAARDLAQKYNVTVHLKSHRSVTATYDSDEVMENTTGNDAMATAGSGDVLSGIMAGLLVQQADPFWAASVGAYIHGLCGDTAAEQLGHASVIASDLLDAIQRVLRGLEQ